MSSNKKNQMEKTWNKWVNEQFILLKLVKDIFNWQERLPKGNIFVDRPIERSSRVTTATTAPGFLTLNHYDTKVYLS